MRTIALTLLILTSYIFASGKPTLPTDIVQAYADNLHAWCETKDVSRYSNAIKELCSDGFRVNDDIVCDWARQKRMQELEHYDFNDYEKCLDELISRGVKITISNIAIDNSAEFKALNYRNNESMALVSCDLSIEGAVNYHVKELFKIRNGKIVIINNYFDGFSLGKALILYRKGNKEQAFMIFKSRALEGDYRAWEYMNYMLIKDEAHGLVSKEIKNYYIALYLLDKGYVRKLRTSEELCNLIEYDRESLSIPNPMDGTKEFFLINLRKYFAAIPYIGKLTYKELSNKRGSIDYIAKYKVISYLYKNSPIPYKKGKKWGFINGNGKKITTKEYSFCYPFDKITKLALCRDDKGKWGYINEEDKVCIPFIYDAGFPEFRDGTTYVIKAGKLILINSKGEEIRSFAGYSDIILNPENKDEIYARMADGNHNYAIIDFNGDIKCKFNWMNYDKFKFSYWTPVNDNKNGVKLYRNNDYDIVTDIEHVWEVTGFSRELYVVLSTSSLIRF
jgi:hypothetical protein